MTPICEHTKDSFKRTCRICESAQLGRSHAKNNAIIGIDESELAWFYITPGCEDRESCRRLLARARNLSGLNAWAVIQADHAACETLCREMVIRVVESYLNEADKPFGLGVHIVQATQRDVLL